MGGWQQIVQMQQKQEAGKLKLTESSGPGDGEPSLLLLEWKDECEGYAPSSRKFPTLFSTR